MSIDWEIKYRPKILDDLCTYPDLKKRLLLFQKQGSFPHLLLYGNTGSGKTTIARMLCSDPKFDTREINCNEYNDIKKIRGLINPNTNNLFWITQNETMVYILDEFSEWDAQKQKLFLKVMEHDARAVRYIICTNDFGKVVKQIRSRCTCIPSDVAEYDDDKNSLVMHSYADMSVDDWKKILKERAIQICDIEKKDGAINSYSEKSIDKMLDRPVYCTDVRTFIRALEQQIKMDEM